jgi:hypothetical protein
MYVERKTDGITGEARIGRVTFSKSGQSIYYRGKRFEKLNPRGFKANYFDVETGERYWISGCKRDGGDRLYPGTIEIDDDVREEYWTLIRRKPELKEQRTVREVGKHGGKPS